MPFCKVVNFRKLFLIFVKNVTNYVVWKRYLENTQKFLNLYFRIFQKKLILNYLL